MNSETVDLDGLTIRGISIAGVQTCIEVPSWDLAFDIGKCPESSTRQGHVFFTHGHLDHVGGVAHHAGTRSMQNLSAPRYITEHRNLPGLTAVIDAFRMLDRSALDCSLHGMAPGDEWELTPTRRVRAFRSVHRIPTLGYALIGTRHVLRDAYVGVPGPEIAAARARGEDVRRPVERIELAFCGDTTIDVLEQAVEARTAKRLILECTFLDDRVSVERARKTGHVHLDQLCERAHLFENDAILLTHFSRRYSAPQIQDILTRRLPASLQGRVRPLLAGFRS